MRSILFASATLAAVLVIGYYFGTLDQGIHIPFLKASSDPTLYPNDPFLALRTNQFSFFWYFFIPFYRLGVLEPVLFIVHLLVTYLTFHAIWDLAYTLFDDALSALFAVIALIVPHFGMVLFPIIEFSLLNRTFVLPFALMAITLYLRGRKVQSFLLLGVMYNLHVLTVNFTLILLAAASLRDLIRSGREYWKVIATQVIAFGVTALPVLVWRFGSARLDFSIRPEWVYTVGYGMLHHLFYFFAPQVYILVGNVSGVAALGLFLIAERNHPSPRHASVLRWMAASALLVLLVQFIATTWLPVTIIMQLQIARVSTFLLILCLLYFAHYLAQEWRAQKGKDGPFLLTAGMFFLIPSALFPLLSWTLCIFPMRSSRKESDPLVRQPVFRFIPRWLAVAVVPLVFGILSCSVFYYKLWQPGIHIYPASTPWVQVQIWARNNTRKDAVFITPPQLWDLYTPDWRVFSERTDVASITDVLEIALLPEYLDIWLPRIKALAPGAYEQFNGDFTHSRRVIAQAYYTLSEEAILSDSCQFHADYLVFEKPNQRNFPIIYQNRGFVVYDLAQVKNCGAASNPQN